MRHWKLNTSNQGKFEEFKKLFAAYGYPLEISRTDLKEIDADPLTVVVHKASQFKDAVIVDDSSLDVEGASFGIHIRSLLDHLENSVGHKATWTVLLAYRMETEVLIFKGAIQGQIVNPKGEHGFGFDPVFMPEGSLSTLAEDKPDCYNARALAVKALIDNAFSAKMAIIDQWDGPWQS